MPKFSCLLALTAALLIVAACGDDDDPGNTGTASGSPSEDIDPALAAQLESILLKQEEVPEGLQGGSLAYSTNEQLAGPSQEELDRLEQLGRLLGADIAYLPTGGLGEGVPGRGGIQNSASVYETTTGATETFATRAEAARTNNWAENYSDLADVRWNELDRPLGDESAWIRITGLEECMVETPSPGPGAPTPGGAEPTCAVLQQAVIDQVVIRAGRTFIYFQVTSAVPAGSVEDIFIGQVEVWANAVIDRARTTFP